MSLYAGIDVSSKDFKVRILDRDGNEAAKRFHATNDRPGVESLARHLRQACTERQDNHLVVGMEATSVYSWHLQMSLAEEPSLIPMHPQIYSFNPKVITNFKKAYVDLPKTGLMLGLLRIVYALDVYRKVAKWTSVIYPYNA